MNCDNDEDCGGVILGKKKNVELVALSFEHEMVFDQFQKFHDFGCDEEGDKSSFCQKHEIHPLFLESLCRCAYCTKYNDDMRNTTVLDFIAKCYVCRNFPCNQNPELCIGCAFSVALMGKDITLFRKFLEK